SDLNVEGSLFGCLERCAAPNGPIAAPGAVERVDAANTAPAAVSKFLRDVVVVVVGLVTTHYPDRETVGDVHISADLTSPLFVAGVISDNTCDRTPAASVLQATNDVRRVVLERYVNVGVAVAAFFERHDGREAVAAGEGVADEVGAVAASEDHVVVDDVAEVTREGHEGRFIETNAQAAELDVSVTQRAVFVRTVSVFFAVTAAVPVVTQFGEGLQGAEFGFRSGREAKRCTGVLAPGVALAVAQRTSVNAIAARSVVTNIAMNTQAGFGAWDVEVAGAVSIADADIFNGFWL